MNQQKSDPFSDPGGSKQPLMAKRFQEVTLNKVFSKEGAEKLESEEKERDIQITEIYIEPTFRNKLKLYLFNVYEVALICFGIAVSLGEDDIPSLFYQILMQILLCLSMKQMGKHAYKQKLITLITSGILLLTIITKFIVMAQLSPLTAEDYKRIEPLMLALGFEFVVADDGTATFHKERSNAFEVIHLTVNLLLFFYYSKRVPIQNVVKPVGYINHSMWLKQYMVHYYSFFILIIVDTFYARNIFQFVILCFIILIMYLWAYKIKHKNEVIAFAIVWIQRLYIIQIIMLELTQISYISEFHTKHLQEKNTLLILGLVLNKTPRYQAVAHVFLICGILGFGQLYEASFANYKLYLDYRSEIVMPDKLASLTKAFLKKDKQNDPNRSKGYNDSKKAGISTRQLTNQSIKSQMNQLDKKDIKQAQKKNASSFNFTKFIEHNAPYVYMWILRFLFLFYSYFYYGVEGFFILSWVLLSLIMPLVSFVRYTVLIVTPLFTVSTLFLYFINIPGLLLNVGDKISAHPVFTIYRGIIFKYPTLETGYLFLIVLFLILLIPTRYILKLQRDEFRISLFSRLTDRSSNFLWQLLFYIIKWCHSLVLLLVFIYGMREINVFYIGIMFFFIVFASSIQTYRKSGKTLMFYTAFFIWIQYVWNLVKTYPIVYEYKYVSQIVSMLVFTEVKQSTDDYFDYDIPYGQWVILLLYVILANINYAFRKDKKVVRPNVEGGDQVVEYASTADYYEEKCDAVLRKKFPKLSKIINRIVYISSEMMILLILILQGLILVFQSPNLLFWGFMIFSLTLQRVVISAGDENKKLYQRCARQSGILKIYSMLVIILQVTYYFFTNPQFLKRYQLQDVLSFDPKSSSYLGFIGLENLPKPGDTTADEKQVQTKFISQIAFYIMAVILEDYFTDKMKKLNMIEEEYDSFKQQSVFQIDQSKQHTNLHNIQEAEDEENDTAENEKIEYQFEKVRYTIPFMVYKQLHLWRFHDFFAQNFYLISATVTIIFCTQWQISLFMAFYLNCTVVLCIKAAQALHTNGQNWQEKRKEISVDEAHLVNKEYMYKASSTLQQVRGRQWNIQYWLLILSMIIMYPTPFIERFKQNHPDPTGGVRDQKLENTIFWLFWCGIYVDPNDLSNVGTHAPYYLLVAILILEKYAQRWMKNRFGCTLEKITQFKTLEEQIKLIEHKKSTSTLVNEDECAIPKFEKKGGCLTIGEARLECQRIKCLYKAQTQDKVEKRLKNTLLQGIARKYTIQFRSGMKTAMEQISLLLLLLSCAQKSNIVSILYLIILLCFLLIKNKTTGMLIMSYSFGILLSIQYIAVLLNLTSLSSPYEFPPQFPQYPNSTYPYGYHAVPLYLKSEFLRNNLEWTNFFGFDIEHGSINNIWFDFANLALLTIYFYNYGNPINSKNIKVSFSFTKSLEQALNEYSQIQIQKKANLKIAKLNKEDQYQTKITEDLKDENGEELQYSEIAADDSREYFLGATQYLNELKQTVFVYTFTKKSRYFLYIGWQIVTLIMIFLLAFLCKSFMSLGYMIACVPLILYINEYFNQEQLSSEGKKWQHPYFICGPIMIYSFFDIALQILNQIPFHEETLFQTWMGFEKIFTIRITTPEYKFDEFIKGDIVDINYEHLKMLMLKCLNLFFIFLQSRIYESDQFQKFMKRDLRKLITLAKNYKRQAITYRFNNWKLQKIVSSQQNRRKMYEGVAQLKLRIKIWQELVLGRLAYKSHDDSVKKLNQESLKVLAAKNQEISNNQTPLLNKMQTMSEVLPPTQNLIDQDQIQTLQIDVPKKKVMFAHMETKIKVGLMANIFDKDEEIFEKAEILKQMKAKLPRCARFYLWLKTNYIQQVLFYTDVESSSAHKKDMQVGNRTMHCDFEKAMISDISLHYKKHQKTQIKGGKITKKQMMQHIEEDDYKLEQLPKTSELLTRWSQCQLVFTGIIEATLSNFSTLAYLFMIISQIVSGGLITILYPFAIFGYALMEEGRPGKQFWDVMIKYTLFILFMKFIFQLDCWLSFEDLSGNYNSINDWFQFGLWRCESSGQLFLYIIPEIMILASIMGQCYYENLIGLYNHREIDIENIEQARDRYFKAVNGKKVEGGSTTVMEVKRQLHLKFDGMEEEVDDEGQTYEDRMIDQRQDFKIIKQFDQNMNKLKAREFEDFIDLKQEQNQKAEEFKFDVEQFLPERRYSMMDDQDLRVQISQKIKMDRKLQKKYGFIRKHFGGKAYFQRLFPLIKEQKPGVDLYANITFIQFILCVFLISFYTSMDTEGTQNLESSSQFSFNMVMVLFVQVFVMILERYINRTNTKIIVKKVGAKKGDQDDSEMSEEQILSKLKAENLTPKSLSIHVEHQKTQDSILQKHISHDGSDDVSTEIPKISLEYTRMTPQQITKFFLQWVLLIIYHYLIFWYYPINSNYVIYGSPTCNKDSKQFKNYGCLGFHTNLALQVFYIIFCIYFTLSAIQLRYGLPDTRRGSSLQVKYNRISQITWLLYLNIPFLLELKTILDWCFTRTALDMFQWLQLAIFHSEMYLAKISGNFTFNKKYGAKIHWIEKMICGCIFLGIFAFFLLGPFLMFSNLSFIASYNLVTDATVSFNMKIEDQKLKETYQFPIFTATHPLNIETMREPEYVDNYYDVLPETKFFKYDQIQKIKIKSSSETEWALSGDYREMFQQLLKQSSEGDPNIEISIYLLYTFDRPGPALAQTTKGIITRKLNSRFDFDNKIIREFYTASNLSCSANPEATSQINLENFIIPEIRLTEKQKIGSFGDFEPETLTLSYSCENFWEIFIDDHGIIFTAFSDLISSGFMSATSIMGFYLGVAFIVGGTFRKTFIYSGDRVFIVDSPNTEAILNILDCIHMMRLEKNIKKEEEYFHIILEVLRSGELLKHICGSSLREAL